MSGAFTRDTAVERVAPGRYRASVHDGWDVDGAANGGYVLAIAARAMADAVGRPPLTVTAHYLAPARPGVAEIEVEVLRSGRRLATATATLTVAGVEVIRVLGTFAAYATDSLGDEPPSAEPVTGAISGLSGGVLLDDVPRPELLPYEQCVGHADPDRPGLPAINSRLALRLRPGDEGFAHGRPTGRAEFAGWFAFADHEPVDAIGLLLAADAFPPPIFQIGMGPAWVPTIELTVHIRGLPAPGPLMCVFRTQHVADSVLSEDGDLWDSTGRLVAQCRQLALTPRLPR